MQGSGAIAIFALNVMPYLSAAIRHRLWALIWTLAVTEFRLKFFGSVLGYLWQLMRPLLLFGVLYAVFSTFLQFTGPERYYPVALLLGSVQGPT